MEIIDQQGGRHKVFEVEMQETLIKGINAKDRRKKFILGKYKDIARSAEVFSTIYEANSKGEKKFEMPAE